MSTDTISRRYGPAAVVTGASSGIGRAFARLLASEGLDLVLVARRIESLEELAAELRQQHDVEVTTCEIDLSSPTGVQAVVDAAASLDVGLVVSNAGFGLRGDYDANDPAAMADMLMVNCHTPMLLAHGFIPRLRQRGRGGIIFTASIEALIGCPYSAAYSATKGFVKNLGEGLWGELHGESIDVLVLCPGATDTEALAKQGVDPNTMQELKSPDEVAELALANIRNGPVYISSDHYRAMFDGLLALPRRDALSMMAGTMKPPG
jgi:short-subunit dehydrogenase